MRKEIITDLKGFINRCSYYASNVGKVVSSYDGGIILGDYDVKSDSSFGYIELLKKENNEIYLVIYFKASSAGNGWSYRLLTRGKNKSTLCAFSDDMPDWMLKKESEKHEVEVFYSMLKEYC